MSISIDANTLYNQAISSTTGSSINTGKLENALSEGVDSSTDEELMDVCKSFETYFVEQVYKEMKKTVESSESNEYTEMFSDMLTTEYAESVSESGQIGIAQMLYDSMKR